VSTCIKSNELGFDRPGALARYFAKRWLSAKGERLIAWLLEVALGRNSMYFIEKTKEYVDKWGGSGEIVPANAFDGFAITGDPVEDTIIPHAVLVWTCMNDRPWGEEVYHRWLDSLLVAGSAEAAYLAASLWPAHDLMAKVTYRPAAWLVYRGQLDAEAERLILTEMLRGYYGPRTSLYGSFEYDDVPNPWKLPEQYMKRHGFTHPICGLVWPTEIELDRDLRKCIYEALVAPSWSEETKGAAMLLYLSLKRCAGNSTTIKEFFNILEQNLFKLDDRHINIINFNTDKIEKIDYDLMKDYINYLIILYNHSTKIFSKYMSIGLRTKDIFYIGKNFRDSIFDLILKEKEKVESWLEKQTDDLRIKDLLLATYMAKRINYSKNYYIININKELQNEQVYKKIEDIYGKIKYIDKIKLFVDQARIYFNQDKGSYKICSFIDDILKRELKINFNYKFIKDYSTIMYIWHPNRMHVLSADIFFEPDHIGLCLYYEILTQFREQMAYFIFKKRDRKLYSYTKKKVIENLYIKSIDNIEVKLNLYLNKIESNNLPYKEIKYELINIMKNNYDKILEYFKDKKKLEIARKAILSDIDLFWDELRNSMLIELFGINSKSQNIII